VSEFLAMGGYGAYVWIAYGVTALSLLLLFLWSWFGAQARETELAQVRQLSRSGRQAPSSGRLHDEKSADPAKLAGSPLSASSDPISDDPMAGDPMSNDKASSGAG